MDFILLAVKDPGEQLTCLLAHPLALYLSVFLSFFPLCSYSHPNALIQDQAL